MGKNKIIQNSFKCKCCLGEDELKDLWTEYYNDGEREIYGEMLNDCFALNWEPPTIDSDIEHICSTCVSKLHHAVNFKKEIFISTQLFMEEIKNDSCEMKIEDDSDNYIETEYLNIEDLEDEEIGNEKSDIKMEFSTQKINELYTKMKSKFKNYTEEDFKKCLEAVKNKTLSQHKASLLYNIPRWTIRNGLNKMENLDEHLRLKSKDPFLYKFQDNMDCLMKCTNATPFKGFLRVGYACYFCPKEYEKPSDLKIHTIEIHTIEDTLSVKVQSKTAVKLDVTDLMCNICNAKMDTLKDVLEHLSAIHEKNIHNDALAFLIPFKFDSELLKCAVCSQKYQSFKPLNDHMYANHYKNYQCSICGRGFVNKKALHSHSYRHESGVFKCKFCSKEFSAKVRRFAHERAVHFLKNKRLRCGYCSERFTDAVKKKEHEVTEHSATPPIYRCQACSKTYKSQRSLTSHIQSYHLLHHPYKCTKCDYSTYKHTALKNHLHTRHSELV